MNSSRYANATYGLGFGVSDSTELAERLSRTANGFWLNAATTYTPFISPSLTIRTNWARQMA